MARAYSDDLRRKFVEAHERGEGSLAELARRFGVSEGWAEKVSAARHRTGKIERPAGGKRGRKSRITAEVIEYLRSQVKRQPDRTLVELQADLRESQSVEIGITWLWIVLRQMGLRLKKSRSAPPSRTVSESRHNASSGKSKLATSTRRNSSSLTKAVSRRK
jgi:transposase